MLFHRIVELRVNTCEVECQNGHNSPPLFLSPTFAMQLCRSSHLGKEDFNCPSKML